jgi:hypothetical protein
MHLFFLVSLLFFGVSLLHLYSHVSSLCLFFVVPLLADLGWTNLWFWTADAPSRISKASFFLDLARVFLTLTRRAVCDFSRKHHEVMKFHYF